MRYLKRLLAAIYGFLGAFAVVCLIMWAVTGDEPTALIAGVFAAAGVESAVGGIIKLSEGRKNDTQDSENSEDIPGNGRAE